VLRARRHVQALLQADASCDVATLVRRDVERLGQAGITGEEEVMWLLLSLLPLLSLLSLLSQVSLLSLLSLSLIAALIVMSLTPCLQ
jgi:hypothetical protein